MLNKDKVIIGSSGLKGESWGDFPGYVLRRVVDPESGGSAYFRMSLVTLEPMSGTPRHVHYGSDEAWYIVDGEGVFFADGQKKGFSSGDFIFIHKSVVHQLVNSGKTVLKYIAITAPPCDFKTDVHLVEEFDRSRHSTLEPEAQPSKVSPDFPGIQWVQRLQQEVNADKEFAQAAEWFDGSILLVIGSMDYWIKVFMGKILLVREGKTPFGATFSLRGEETAWRKLLNARKNMMRELLFNRELVIEGNLFESMRLTKAVNVLLDIARRMGI